MKLKEFIEEYDYPDSIVLLEGKRKVLEEDQPQLEALGRLLAQITTHVLFRSGNALGADFFFSKGVASVDKKRMQVITPYQGHRKKTNVAYETVSLDDVDLLGEPEVVFHSKSNKKTEKLIDKYVAGERDRFAIKAAYIIRDTLKVLGTQNVRPITFGIFYDDLNNPKTGGTGHTMDVCNKNSINQIDQTIWMNWLKKNKLDG